MKLLEDLTKRIDFEFPEQWIWKGSVPCISMFGNIVDGKSILWIHHKRILIKNSDVLSEKTLKLLNAHAYDFVKYMEELKEG